MKIHDLINLRLGSASCYDIASEEYYRNIRIIDSEVSVGLWTVTDVGASIGISDDPIVNRHVGCEIVAAKGSDSWPVLKDTIVQRMKAQGLLANLAAMVGSLPTEDRFEFDQSSWFASSNPRIRGGITACGGDPDTILAFDPMA